MADPCRDMHGGVIARMHANGMGKWLREHRESQDLTQGQVAAELGLSQSGYSNIERGNVTLSGRYMTPLAKLFDVPRTEIVDQALGILTDVERAILKDDKLSARDCRLLLLVYGDRTGRNSAEIGQSLCPREDDYPKDEDEPGND